MEGIPVKCLRALSDLFSPNLIDQSSCKTGLVSTFVVRIWHDDWSIRLGDNRPDKVLKHLAAMLTYKAKRSEGLLPLWTKSLQELFDFEHYYHWTQSTIKQLFVILVASSSVETCSVLAALSRH